MARLLGHRQTKEAATAKPNLRSPRHISTLPFFPVDGPLSAIVILALRGIAGLRALRYTINRPGAVGRAALCLAPFELTAYGNAV